MDQLTVYLSGEIHTNWRDEIIKKSKVMNLPIVYTFPVTNHELSDDCGVKILGPEKDKFWHDHKSAKINAIRTRRAIEQADLVIIKFGDKYKQWNAAFDAGFATAITTPIVIIHEKENQHALKEIDAAAFAVTKNIDEAINILKYTTKGII